MVELDPMARPKSDPGAAKYQSSFENFVQAILKVPKEAIEQAEAQRPKRVRPKHRLNKKT